MSYIILLLGEPLLLLVLKGKPSFKRKSQDFIFHITPIKMLTLG